MDFLVTVEDSKAPFFLELMKNLRPVKVESLSAKKTNGRVAKRNPEKEAILQGLRNAIEEVKLAKQGKIKLKSARELLREL